MRLRLLRLLSPDFDGAAGGTAAPEAPAAPAPVAAEAPIVEPVIPTPVAPTLPTGLRLEDAVDQLLKRGAAETATAETTTTTTSEPAAPGSADEAPSAPAAGGTAPVSSALTVELPPREADGAPITLTVETPEQAEAINRLRNGYARREQVQRERAAIEAQVQAMEAFRARLERDPIGFLTESIPEAVQTQVLQVLVARLHASQRDVIENLTVDEAARERALREAVETRQTWQREYDEQAEVRAYQRSINDAVTALIPETATARDEQAFVRFATTYLSDVLRNTNEPVTPDTVPVLLADYTTRFFGGAPSASAPAAPAASASVSSGAAVPAPVVPAPAVPPAATPKVVPLTPAQLHARAAAAAVVPAGAGASPSTLEKPPAGMRLEQAIEWYQKRATVAAS